MRGVETSLEDSQEMLVRAGFEPPNGGFDAVPLTTEPPHTSSAAFVLFTINCNPVCIGCLEVIVFNW